MARSKLSDLGTDLQSDSGSVLWSFVQGEQGEYPVTLSFLENAGAGYIFEAAVVEAKNVSDDDTVPSTIMPGAITTELVVRIPEYVGEWNSISGYSRNQVTSYGGKYYYAGNNVNSGEDTPGVNPVWVETALNVIYIQFPKTLSVSPAWAVQPTVNAKIRGFFELRVTEPTVPGIFPRTWKPLRGVIEYQFSPTEIVE